jgi:hypothetical protein
LPYGMCFGISERACAWQLTTPNIARRTRELRQTMAKRADITENDASMRVNYLCKCLQCVCGVCDIPIRQLRSVGNLL